MNKKKTIYLLVLIAMGLVVFNSYSQNENTNGYIFHILLSGSNYVICLNDSNNPFNADLYCKFVFTNITTNEFNLCQPFYDSVSQIDIENTTDPTDSDDLNSGCGGFAWSEMVRD